MSQQQYLYKCKKCGGRILEITTKWGISRMSKCKCEKLKKMTKPEYFSKLNEIRQKQYEIERELQIDFAMANNPYKVGDIFKDHCGQIKIKMIK